MTRKVIVGPVEIGGGAPVSVQTMTNTDTRNVEATLAQIRAMAAAGADIVRVSVYDDACAEAIRALVDGSPVPLVADIHFNHRLAIKSIENGIAKVRINPGNIGGEAHVKELADCLKIHHVPVRIGVNSGSIEKDILKKHGGVTPQGMVESGLNHARMLEKAGFEDIVLSFKATDVNKMVNACRLAAKVCDYPQHIGVTESGTADVGIVKSAVGIGALLIDGIGDTIRVSLSGDPVQEVPAGLAILRACGVRRVRVVDPYNLEECDRVLKEELAVQAPSVIISRRPCALLKYVKHNPPLRVNTDKCIGCKSCMQIGCPSISIKNGKASVDSTLCVGCGVCSQLCRFSAFESTADAQ